MDQDTMLFNKLHPICTELIKSPNKQKIKQFYDLIQTLIVKNNNNSSTSSQIDEYLYIPLLTILKEPKHLDVDTHEQIYLTLQLILKTFALKKFPLFQHILNLATFSNENIKKKSKHTSDEYLFAYLDLLNALFTHTTDEVHLKFYNLNSLTTIGLLVSTGLEHACAEGSSLNLRLKAVSLLKTLITPRHVVDSSLLSLLFTSFLPGVTINIVQNFLLKANIKLLNHKIICECLDFLSVFLSLNLNNAQFDGSTLSSVKIDVTAKIRDLLIDKKTNTEWTSKTQANLVQLLSSLINLLKLNGNSMVRLALVRLLQKLTHDCWWFFFALNNNENSLKIFLNLFVDYYTCDDSEAVRDCALSCLTSLKDNLKMFNLFTICVNSLNDILIRIQLVSNKQAYLRLINGYLSLLSLNGYFEQKFYFTNGSLLKNLQNALMLCVQFDYRNLNNLIQIGGETGSGGSRETERFDYITQLGSYKELKTFLNDETSYVQLESICCFIGSNDSMARIFIDIMLYDNQNENFQLNERLFILNQIIRGMTRNGTQDEVIENLLSYLTTGINEANETEIDKQNERIIRKCIILESILNCSNLVTQQTAGANRFLINTLSFILIANMNDNFYIKLCAIKCLNELSRNFGEESITILLKHNYDYIVNNLLIELNENTLKASTVAILCSLCEICDETLNVYLDKILNLILFKFEFLNSSATNDATIMALRFFGCLAQAYKRWFHLELNSQTCVGSGEVGNVTENVFKNEILSLQSQIDEYEEKLKGKFESKAEDFEGVEEKSEEEKKVELHVKLQSDILDLCQHVVSHPSEHVRMLAIDLIAQLCLNLSENKNTLLPLVHKLWSPICKRFFYDKHSFVRIRIFNLVHTLSGICGDFINDRFIKEILPYLNEFMTKQSCVSLSYRQRNDLTYVYSGEFKLQCEILARLHELCACMNIKQFDLEAIVDNCVLVYFDKRQPARLQELALNSMRCLARIDSDLIWLCLHYILPFDSLTFDLNNEDDLAIGLNEKFEHSTKISVKHNLLFEKSILVELLRLFKSL